MRQKLFDLSNVNLERVDLVDEPCVPKAKFIIIKNKNKEEGLMEDIIKAVPEPLSKAIMSFLKACEDNMDGVDDKMKKRLNLVVGNLKGMVKKSEEGSEGNKDDSGQELLAEMKQELREEMQEEIEKAGKSISKATEVAISKVVTTLQEAVKALQGIGKKEMKEEKEEEDMQNKYEKPYEEKYPKVKKSEEALASGEDIRKSIKKTFNLYKSGIMSDDELQVFINTLTS